MKKIIGSLLLIGLLASCFDNDTYIVLQANDSFELKKEVERYMEAGWNCQGGIAVYLDKNGVPRYTQAMVAYTNKEGDKK